MAENKDYQGGQMDIDEQAGTWTLFMDATKIGGLLSVGLVFLLLGMLSMGLGWIQTLVGVLIFVNVLGAIFETRLAGLASVTVLLVILSLGISFIQ